MTEPTTTMMKALGLGEKGATNEIEIARPKPTATEVLVKVAYSALDTTIPSFVKKDMTAGYIHDMKAKPLVVGYHFSGSVAEVGSDVTTFDVGNLVFGHLQYEPKQRQGAYSEYITVSQDSLALVPSKNVTLEQAAASATEALTALQAMRDMGGLEEGKSILIIGAGGGVGSLAVGIAKALGASNVTAVCSTKDVERVQQMGADLVVDRSKQDPRDLEEKFDVVFDVPSKYGFRQGMKWLKPGGVYVNTLPSVEKMVFGWFWPLITDKRLETVLVESKKTDLELVGSWMADGRLTVDIDSVYNISDFAAASQRQNDSKKNGRVVVKVKDGW